MNTINEVKEAEHIIETNKFKKFSSALSLIIRYYIQIKNYSKKETIDAVNKFISLNKENYIDWEETVEKMIKNAKKYPLCQINEIPLTKKEIEVVRNSGNKKKQKVLFTFLVLAKLKYLRNGNTWIRNTDAEIFKRANAESTFKERGLMIYDFREAGYITLPKSPMNMSLHIEFIDVEGEPELIVTDLRNLGYRWLKYCGEKYIECQECGKLFKPAKGNSLYCKDHRGYIPLRTKIIECCDCGISFETASTSNKNSRCPLCSRLRRNEKQRELMKRRKI